jgi:hypothetical protein
MSAVAVGPELPPDVDQQLDGLPPMELAVGVLTYNNAATVPTVVDAIRGGLEKHLTGTPAVLINADAGSSDATVERLADSGLPLVRARTRRRRRARRGAVSQVPGRGAALRLAVGVARRLGVRAPRARGRRHVGHGRVDRATRPARARARRRPRDARARAPPYDGTITNLVLARSSAHCSADGCISRSPARALSARLIERSRRCPSGPSRAAA